MKDANNQKMNKIPFNKPYLHGRELVYIAESVASGKISGDGIFSKKCHDFFMSRYNLQKVLLTTSCTDALEMCALLLNIKSGDEVIVPAYTFVSSANAFALRGAKIIFADSQIDNPNISCKEIEALITPNTKAIVVVHYAGIACDMDTVLSLAEKYHIPVVEDAAQAVDSFYKGRALGGIGELGTFSFHETKNVIAGEGGLLSINNSKYVKRAEIIREKGTNRSSFFRGEVNKYGWVDIGSSFLPSDIIAAYLYAQLENIETIQAKRKTLWQRYWENLSNVLPHLGIMLPEVPEWATNNAHMFYIVCSSIEQRSELIDSLKQSGVQAVFHYLSLHNSPYFHEQHDGRLLVNSDRFENCLLRLPLYYELTHEEVDFICEKIVDQLKTI
jgi:dTDP-4-amino-4,6-dideoxygalactose transaminase